MPAGNCLSSTFPHIYPFSQHQFCNVELLCYSVSSQLQLSCTPGDMRFIYYLFEGDFDVEQTWFPLGSPSYSELDCPVDVQYPVPS